MVNWDENIRTLEEKIAYPFQDKQFLKEALTHSSYANEQLIHRQESYERIEFLGDAVLQLVVSEYLMDTFPDKAEGDLTKRRALAVCETNLAHNAKRIELGDHIFLGKGEEQTGGRNRNSILADVMEAIIGAVYRDGGLKAAKKFIKKFVLFDLSDETKVIDCKSQLQEKIIKKGLGTLCYQLAKTSGPEHDKIYHVDLYLDDEVIGTGSGKSKKAAEQQAAHEALQISASYK